MKKSLPVFLLTLSIVIFAAACTEDVQNPQPDDSPPDVGSLEDHAYFLMRLEEATRLIAQIEDSLDRSIDDIEGISRDAAGSETGEINSRKILQKLGRVLQNLSSYKQQLEFELNQKDSAASGGKEPAYEHYINTITHLRAILEAKSRQIEDLEEKLEVSTAKLQDAVKSRIEKERQLEQTSAELLNAVNIAKQHNITIDELKETIANLRKGFYIARTKDELLNKGFYFVDEGMFGSGGYLVAPRKLMNSTTFDEIDDILSYPSIRFQNEIKKIHSVHAYLKEAYEVKQRSLMIHDPQLFWSVGKYLVIELKD